MLYCTIVLGLFAADLPGEAAYIEGREAERLGRVGDASAAYARCLNEGGPLEPYAAIRAAAVRAKVGDLDGALAGFQAVAESPDGPWRPLARYERASALKLKDRFEEAAADYDAALDTDLPLWWLNDARWEAAEAFVHADGLASRGYGFFKGIVRDTILRQPRLDAATILMRSPDPADRVEAGMGLLRSGGLREAATVVSSLMKFDTPPASVGPGIEIVAARMQLETGDKRTGRDALMRIAEQHASSVWAPVACRYAAKADAQGGAFESAEALVRRMDETYLDSPETAEAHWQMGISYAAAEKPDDALRHYVIIAARNADHERAPRALLAAGDLCRAAGRVRDAVTFYDRLANSYPEVRQAPQAAYESGRLLTRAGDSKGARERFETAVRIGFGNYYGHRAKELLDGLSTATYRADGRGAFVAPIESQPVAPASVADDGDEALARLKFFAAHGLPEAEWEALYLARRLGKSEADARLYAALGEAGVAYSAMQIADYNGWGEGDDWNYSPDRRRIQYPLAYWETVRELADVTGVDPFLVLAIARQESTYRPALTSSAGASGVMQLMPPTAKWLEKVEPAVQACHIGNLENPQNSLRLGAYYLMRMIDRSDGNLVFAIASYNAGPGNCDKWRVRFPGADMADFVENIPFEETREYVKRVLGNYAAYHSLYTPGR